MKFKTTKGDFTVEVSRAWAPKGADRFYRLVTEGYFKDIRFFRVLPGFMAQFGMSGNPALNAKLDSLRIPDDPVTQSNKRGMVTFATSGPNTRSNQLFINYADNGSLDSQGFSPFGRVVDGMKVVDAMYGGYGEGAPNGKGPSQDSIVADLMKSSLGNARCKYSFPFSAIESWLGPRPFGAPSPYPLYSASTVFMPSTTFPKGEKPCESSEELSL